MAILKTPLSKSEINRIKLPDLKKEYTSLSDIYGKIVNNEYIYCPICGEWQSAKINFYTSQFSEDGYNHYGCKSCILKEATDVNKDGAFVDNKDKTKAVLMKLDLPFIESLYDDLYDKVDKTGFVDKRGGTVAFPAYITIIKSLPNYSKLQWKDSKFNDTSERIDLLPTKEVRKGIIKLFGDGLTTQDYLFLQDQYDDWKARTQVDTKSQETYIVNICMIQLQIHNAQKAGKDTSKLLDTLNKLMDAARLQPKQNVGNASTDDLTFGQLIEKWEQEKPIPEPEEQFKDVDGIGKYIRVWFAGHLAKALGLKGGRTEEYEQEIKKYTVEKPQAQDGEASSDELYQALFGSDGDE